MVWNITDTLSFSFPFPLSPSSIENSTVTNMFYIWVCIWSCLFLCICWICVYVWIYLPHRRENIRLLCFWSWLPSLSMMSFNCIHLPSNSKSLFLVVG
jgi:hypothetical protein